MSAFMEWLEIMWALLKAGVGVLIFVFVLGVIFETARALVRLGLPPLLGPIRLIAPESLTEREMNAALKEGPGAELLYAGVDVAAPDSDHTVVALYHKGEYLFGQSYRRDEPAFWFMVAGETQHHLTFTEGLGFLMPTDSLYFPGGLRW